MKNNTITSEQLKKKLDQGNHVYILDVRDEKKYLADSIELEAVVVKNIPYVQMIAEDQHAKMDLDQLPKDAEIVTLCTTGNKAQKAAAFLQGKGYSAVALQGGLTAWKESMAE